MTQKLDITFVQIVHPVCCRLDVHKKKDLNLPQQQQGAPAVNTTYAPGSLTSTENLLPYRYYNRKMQSSPISLTQKQTQTHDVLRADTKQE